MARGPGGGWFLFAAVAGIVGALLSRRREPSDLDISFDWEIELPPGDEAKLDELVPEFAAAARLILLDLRAEGLQYVLGDAYRSLERSADLYAAYQAGGPLAAPPGSSAHNYRAGLDIYLTDGRAVLADDDPRWDRIGELAARYGVDWGGNWSATKRDAGHVELPGWQALREVA